MTQNILFNFLQQPVQFDAGVKLIKDKNTDGIPYYRLEMPNKRLCVYSSDEQHQYRRESHHISVYNNQDHLNPMLSQYHYTAYFVDELGAEYQLHVYFDDKDNITTAPILSKKNAADIFHPIDSKSLDDQLVDIARLATTPIIQTIKNQLNQTTQTLIDTYKTLELQACELSQAEDKIEAYLRKLGEIIKVLEKLNPLIKNKHYQQTKQFLQKVCQTFQNQQTAQEGQDSEPSTPASASEEVSGFTLPFLQPVRAVLPQKPVLDREIQVLSKQFSDLQTELAQRYTSHNQAEKDEIYVKALYDIFQKSNDFSLFLENQECTASPTGLKNLHILQSQIRQHGEKFYLLLLLSGKLTLAAKLCTFHYVLTEKHLTMALASRNHLLLDFLLTHGTFSINSQSITIKGKTYPSAMHYCIASDTPETPMEECLAVLIQHNGSLFLENEKGLPLAHLILSSSDKRLEKSLKRPEIIDKTIGTPEFYKKLILSMQRYLHQCESDQTTSEDIKKIIDDYRLTAVFYTNPLYKQRVIQENSADGAKLSPPRDELQVQLMSEPYIKDLIYTMGQKLKNLTKTAAKHKIKITLPPLHDFQSSNADDDQSQIGIVLQKLAARKISYEQAREEITCFLEKEIQNSEDLERLIEIKSMLASRSYNISKKEAKYLSQEHQTLFKKFRDHTDDSKPASKPRPT